MHICRGHIVKEQNMVPDPTDPPELYLQLAKKEKPIPACLVGMLEGMTLFANTSMTVLNADSPASLSETFGKRVWQHELLH